MPIYDFKCPNCNNIKKDIFTKTWEEEVKCECNSVMEKMIVSFTPKTFPSEGVYLEHVSPEGKTFHSEKQMRKFEKENDVELGYLL